MANYINLRENEYQDMVLGLSAMHEYQLRNIINIINKMRQIVNSEDIFSTNQTSQKITDMLDILEIDVISLLEQVFKDSEEAVANMIDSIVITDSVRDR